MPLPEIDQLNFNECDIDYSSWNTEEKELRAFLLSTQRGMTLWFSQREEAAERSVQNFDPEYMHGDEAYNSFMEDTGIFWSSYWERTASHVIRDAFRIYEVFLFASAHRVLRAYGSGLRKFGTDDTWPNDFCDYFYQEYLGCETNTAEIQAAKWVRNKLTHLDNVDSTEGREKLKKHKTTLGLDEPIDDDERTLGLFHEENDWLFGPRLRFTPLQTWRILNLLREHTNTVGKLIYSFVWERKAPTSGLVGIATGALLKSQDKRQINIPPKVS